MIEHVILKLNGSGDGLSRGLEAAYKSLMATPTYKGLNPSCSVFTCFYCATLLRGKHLAMTFLWNLKNIMQGRWEEFICGRKITLFIEI